MLEGYDDIEGVLMTAAIITDRNNLRVREGAILAARLLGNLLLALVSVVLLGTTEGPQRDRPTRIVRTG